MGGRGRHERAVQEGGQVGGRRPCRGAAAAAALATTVAAGTATGGGRSGGGGITAPPPPVDAAAAAAAADEDAPTTEGLWSWYAAAATPSRGLLEGFVGGPGHCRVGGAGGRHGRGVGGGGAALVAPPLSPALSPARPPVGGMGGAAWGPPRLAAAHGGEGAAGVAACSVARLTAAVWHLPHRLPSLVSWAWAAAAAAEVAAAPAPPATDPATDPATNPWHLRPPPPPLARRSHGRWGAAALARGLTPRFTSFDATPAVAALPGPLLGDAAAHAQPPRQANGGGSTSGRVRGARRGELWRGVRDVRVAWCASEPPVKHPLTQRATVLQPPCFDCRQPGLDQHARNSTARPHDPAVSWSTRKLPRRGGGEMCTTPLRAAPLPSLMEWQQRRARLASPHRRRPGPPPRQRCRLCQRAGHRRCCGSGGFDGGGISARGGGGREGGD